MINILFNVIIPVFLIIFIGFALGKRFRLKAAPFSKVSYFVFIPAFVFNIVIKSDLQLILTAKMILYISAVYIICGLIGFITAKILKRSAELCTAYFLIACFGNVGNLGLSLIDFRLGEGAMTAGAVYFLTIMVVSSAISIAAATWKSGVKFSAIYGILKNPSIIASGAAFFFLITDIILPSPVYKLVSLLSNAMIPLLIITLGIQISEVKKIKINSDVLGASAVRLIGGPVIGLILGTLFSLSSFEYRAGIIQASMPTALLSSIIASEHNLMTDFIVTTVIFSTLASAFTLTIVLYLI